MNNKLGKALVRKLVGGNVVVYFDHENYHLKLVGRLNNVGTDGNYVVIDNHIVSGEVYGNTFKFHVDDVTSVDVEYCEIYVG